MASSCASLVLPRRTIDLGATDIARRLMGYWKGLGDLRSRSPLLSLLSIARRRRAAAKGRQHYGNQLVLLRSELQVL